MQTHERGACSHTVTSTHTAQRIEAQARRSLGSARARKVKSCIGTKARAKRPAGVRKSGSVSADLYRTAAAFGQPTHIALGDEEEVPRRELWTFAAVDSGFARCLPLPVGLFFVVAVGAVSFQCLPRHRLNCHLSSLRESRPLWELLVARQLLP